MGNYSWLRRLYLKDRVIKSTELYKGYQENGFMERESYDVSQLWKTVNGDILVAAESDEDFISLSAWPQEKNYLEKAGWRYRPDLKLIQYWRKGASDYGPSLMLRVNGRAKYWSGGSPDRRDYIDIPGEPSFENFELRGKYHPGQKVYFGITKKTARQLVLSEF